MKAFFALVLGMALLAGCASQPAAVADKTSLAKLVGRQVTLIGTAYHSCPGAVVYDKDCIVLIDGLTFWPSNYDRQRIQVTGRLQVMQPLHLYKIEKASWALAP